MSKKKRLGIKIIIILLIIIEIVWIREREICLKVVVSGSMEPKFPVGSICIIEKNYPIEKIKVGDVIAFSVDENTWITHRVVQISTEGNFLTKGDANETVDLGWVAKSQYKGKTVGYIPYIGVVCMFFSRQKKIMIFVIIILFLWQEIERRKNIANKKRTKVDISSRSLCINCSGWK